MRALMALGMAAVAAVAAGCESNVCGPGSYERAGVCVTSLPPTCGPGTELVGDECTAIEGLEIECGPMTHLSGGACVGDVDVPGNATRYVSMVLSKPDTASDLVNPVVADALASGDMIVLLGALQSRDDEVRIYGGNGVLAEDGLFDFTGEYSYETTAAVEATGFTSQPFTWVIAGLTEVPIVIVDTVISQGELDTTSNVRLVKGGTMTGVLTVQNAKAVTLTVDLDLCTALTGLGVEPDVDYDGNGVLECSPLCACANLPENPASNDGWEAIGQFRAEAVWTFPPAAAQ